MKKHLCGGMLFLSVFSLHKNMEAAFFFLILDKYYFTNGVHNTGSEDKEERRI